MANNQYLLAACEIRQIASGYNHHLVAGKFSQYRAKKKDQ